MDLQKRKLEFIQEFLKIQNEDVISLLEKVLKKENVKAKQVDFNPLTTKQFNARIDQSMEDSKNGHLIESNELKAKIDKWD